MIPVFPQFKKLELSDQKAWNQYIHDHAPYSDFNFVSLWSYDTLEVCHVSMLNQNLVIRFTDYITNQPFYSFLGSNQVLDTINILIALSAQDGLPQKLQLVPEVALISERESIKQQYRIIEDADNHDYVLSIAHLATLKGKRFAKKRSAINQFERRFSHTKLKQIDLTSRKIQASVLVLFEAWAAMKKISQAEASTEKKAIERLFQVNSFDSFINLGLYDQDKLIGYSFEQIVHHNYVMAQFGKADSLYRGIYEYIEHQHAKILQAKGCIYLNYEQDLGIPGLRQSKKSWRPNHFLKKYVIAPKK